MTRTAHSQAIAYYKSELGIVGPSFYMMGNQIASYLSAGLTHIVIVLKDCCTPFFIFSAFSQLHCFRSNAAFPSRIIWPISDSTFFNHCLTDSFSKFWGHFSSLIPSCLAFFKLARVLAARKLTPFQSKIRATLEFGRDFLAYMWSFLALPIAGGIALA